MTKDNFLIPFLTGGFSKSLASFLLMPINVVRLRLQMKQYKVDQVAELGLKVEGNKGEAVEYKSSMVDVAQKIYRNEGVAGFYKGLTPNILKVFPSAGLFFLSYEATLLFLSPSSVAAVGSSSEKVD